MTDTYVLELAHVMPGRIRLRWRGDEGPASAFLNRLDALPCVGEVECRFATRSVLVLGDSSLTADAVREAAAEVGVQIVNPPPPKPVFEPKPRRSDDARDVLWQDVEAALLVVVMLLWVRDLIVNRVFRMSTVLLIVITAMDLYRHWLRRQADAKSKDGSTLETVGV